MTKTPHPPRLWLLRHAQPLIAPGVCYGQLDVPAEPHATVQAALHFGAAMPRTAAVRYSPLQRCAQLAQALPATRNPVTADARLQEMDFGAWEGLPWNDIAQPTIDAWAQDLFGTAPGGGEALREMLQRVHAALAHSWAHDSQRGQRDVVWVTHAGVIRCVHWLQRYGQAQPTSQDWQLPAPAFGQWHSTAWAPLQVALQLK